MNLKAFIESVFISGSGVSSRRVGGFISLITTVVLVVLEYPEFYCNLMALLTIGFFGLTTVTGIFYKPNNNN